MKGLSTISCPIHPRLTESAKKYQKNQRFNGLKKLLRKDDVSTTGRIARITIAIPIKITPPNLSGIVRKIA
jgi:hypothetical protein